MLKGFRDFLLRGNLIDLVTAFVFGHAVHTLVLQFSKSFSEPLIRSLDDDGARTPGVVVIHGVPCDWAAFGASVLHLGLVAAVMYFLIITPISRIRTRLSLESDSDALMKEHTALLREIRDVLKQR